MSATPGSTPLFPLFLHLRGRRVLVVGGGLVARRKIAALLDAGANVRVGAPELIDAVQTLVDAGRVEHVRGTFDTAWLDDAWLVVAATDDASVNRAVADAAEARRIWANVVDDAELSSVQVPARVERGPLQVAISSGGGAPMLARHLRETLEAQLDESWSSLATLLTRYRRVIRARFADVGARRAFFERVIASDIGDLLRAGRDRDARDRLRALLADTATQRRGRVILVGAGPGDAGLLTLRALRVLSQADVVLHDHLVGDDVLSRVRRDAELIDVGKHAGAANASMAHHDTQARIHALMLEHAKAGRTVVRLKGGDPFVFGRGGEELEVLASHGIDFEVVPGITAALACAAYAGIPLTHREHAQSLHVVTAHAKDDGNEPDWAALAKPRQTLAIYMGVAAASRISARLIAHGLTVSTPVAIVENGSRPTQRVVTGTLDSLGSLVDTHAVQSPALLIVGEVAALATTLHWFGAPPLPREHALQAAA
ncbi:siroheme synthase CysG [Cognatilysobacter terrigena]|uniref:siroheme synthase CysG n=1 Tax=Cognatilysobacter terrigena TaxID=2488749 RepID=UPI001FE25422|nr:siroheme synthase CysG [Lysobacter terrigena]